MSFLPEMKREPLDGAVEQIWRSAVIASCAKIERTLTEHGIVTEAKKIDESSTRDDIEMVLQAYEAAIKRFELVGGPQVSHEVKRLSKKVRKIRELRTKADRLEKKS